MKTITAVNIDRNEVCRYLGYKGHTPPAFISSLIDSQIARAYKLIKPTYTYALKAIQSIKGCEVFLEGSLVLTAQTVSYVLSDCEFVAILLTTIGPDLEKESSNLMESGETLKATILDAIGSEAVEKTADRLQDHVEDLAEKMGCQATLRYSPGYCDWDVAQQEVLFKAIDSTVLGVKLTANCMMVPLKSVSGIIGIGKFDKTKPPPCLECSRKASCPYKRTRL